MIKSICTFKYLNSFSINRSDELVPRLRKKIHDEDVIQVLLQKLGLDDMCRNCKKYCCMDRQDVTER